MKCTGLLTLLTLFGLAASKGAWEENKEYTYRLEARTTLRSPTKSSNDSSGILSRAFLSIRPQSSDLLIARITLVEYGKRNEKLSALNDTSLKLPFEIHLENGVIQSLSVDNSLSNYEINQLKVIVSQFQVDSNGHNRIVFSETVFNENSDNDAFFKTMEPIVTGNCETIYDISPIPEYLIKSHPEWVPLPELKGLSGEHIRVVKSRNYENCHESSDYLLDNAGRKDTIESVWRRNHLFAVEDRRIVISGSLESYTIQSSFSVNKVINRLNNSPALIEFVNTTLQSVADVSNGLENEPWHERTHQSVMKNVGNLVYNHELSEKISSVKVRAPPRLTATLEGTESNGDIWSHCWTAFPAASTLCKSEYGPEYADVDVHGCGFLSLGKQALCRHAYSGCVATPCYTAFYSRAYLCERAFGHEYPLTRGGFVDCAPGFYRSRCCPLLQ